MAISTREKEVPTKLPAARLYLDDIAEIREIILHAAASRVLRREIDPAQLVPETKFYVGDQVCTEMEDLPKLKKRTSDFEMRLSAPDGFSARFGFTGFGLGWTTEGLTKADAWRAFHKLETVLDRRRIRWRALVPRDQSNAILLLTLVPAWLLLFFAPKIWAVVHDVTSNPVLVSILFTLVVVALFFPAMVVFLRRGEVVLRYSWDDAARREDRNTKIAIAGVSALIAFALGVASMALKHKIWP